VPFVKEIFALKFVHNVQIRILFRRIFPSLPEISLYIFFNFLIFLQICSVFFTKSTDPIFMSILYNNFFNSYSIFVLIAQIQVIQIDVLIYFILFV